MSRRGLTLVEVVASLALLGSLLVGILVAHRRHAQQIRHAQLRLAAVEAADGLLAKWSAEGTWGVAASAGRFENEHALVWRWSVTAAPQLRRMGAAVGRLEVFEEQPEEDRPLVRVDVVAGDLLPRLARTTSGEAR